MPQTPSKQWRQDQGPKELADLSKQLEQLPFHLRQRLLPLCERLQHYTRLHSRLLRIAQEAVDQLQLDVKYLQFDLEATRRERDELMREMRGFDDEEMES
jgi:cell division protein FtsB